MRGLNLDQLRALLEVVEHGSFSAAARRLHLTQPAVSLQIRELERRFGLQLIERLGKQAHATVPGRELVEAAQRIFRECDQVDATMRRFREGWIGRVRLSMTLTSMVYRLPPILRKIRLNHPGIDLTITNTPTPTSVDNIIHNRIDIALVNCRSRKSNSGRRRFATKKWWRYFPPVRGIFPTKSRPVMSGGTICWWSSKPAQPTLSSWGGFRDPGRGRREPGSPCRSGQSRH